MAELVQCDSCVGIYELQMKKIQTTGDVIPDPRCVYCGCTDYYEAPKGAKVGIGDIDPAAQAAVRPAGRGEGPRPFRPSRFMPEPVAV
jgi:predicted nucleic-acid-binding Zn-ribbon protein